MNKKSQKNIPKSAPKLVPKSALKPALRPAPKLAFDPYDYKKETYKGVNIYTRSLPWANCTFLRWIINHGAQDDKSDKEGTAHFLEHIAFDGNPLYQDKKAIDSFSKEHLLDSLNAHTRFTDTCFVCKFLPNKVKPAMEGMYNLMFKPLMRSEDIEHERKVITQEGWGYFLNEKYIRYLKEWIKNMYKDIPKRAEIISPLGWIDTVEKISKKDLLEAHKNYTRENSNIVLAGVVNRQIVAEIKKIIDLIPSGKRRPNFKIPAKISIPKKIRMVSNFTDIGMAEEKQTLLDIYKIVEYNKTDDHTLEFISIVLKEILHRRLRHDNSWCYGVGVGFWKDYSFINQSIWVKIAPENTKEAERIIWDTIDKFIAGDYKKDAEIERTVKIERIISNEFQSIDIANYAERQVASGKNIETLNKYLHGIYEANYEKAIKYLRENFKKSETFTEIRIPKEFKGRIK